MIIRFFKSNITSSFIFLPFIALAIWVFAFASPSVFPLKHSMPLFELIAGMFISIPWLSVLIAFLLIIGEAFLINYIVAKNELIAKQSYLPALFYIVIISNNGSMLMLHPPLFANLFLMLALNSLLNSYRKDVAFSQAFDSGFLVAIASLFYFPSILFFLLLIVGQILLRSFNWREWVILFIGAILPYVFVISFYFYNDKLHYLWHDKFLYPITHGELNWDYPKTFYFMLILRWAIVLFSIVKILGALNSGTQRTRKGIVLMIWFFVFSAVSVLIAPEISTKYVAAMAIPASVFCAHFFVNIKRGWLAELLFLLLMISIFINII